MRRKAVRRALAALGVFAVVAAGLAAGSSPAGADDAEVLADYDLKYEAANCMSSVITLYVGGNIGIPNVPLGGSGSTYTIRAFCGTAGYTQGQKVFDQVDNRWEYVVPDYNGPSIPENIPGTLTDADRVAQHAAYQADLELLGDRIYQDLGSPPRTPETIEQWWAVWDAAANAQAAVDQINASFSQLIPTKLGADVISHCWSGWWGSWCAPYQNWNGLAKLRSSPAESQNWFWMNNWYMQGGSFNGNIGSSWATPGWTDTTVGNGGILTGCVHSDTGLATGSADATSTHQLWHATSAFGCGIAGGNAEGGALLLTGIRAEYKVDLYGGAVGS